MNAATDLAPTAAYSAYGGASDVSSSTGAVTFTLAQVRRLHPGRVFVDEAVDPSDTAPDVLTLA